MDLDGHGRNGFHIIFTIFAFKKDRKKIILTEIHPWTISPDTGFSAQIMKPFEKPVEIEINGTLDLHTFSPRDIKTLIPEYLTQCRKAGIMQVRIIHGKGRGILRKSVHAILARSDLVSDFRVAGPDAGHWGATLVTLK